MICDTAQRRSFRVFLPDHRLPPPSHPEFGHMVRAFREAYDTDMTIKEVRDPAQFGTWWTGEYDQHEPAGTNLERALTHAAAPTSVSWVNIHPYGWYYRR